MTRRERMMRIIESHGAERAEYEFRYMMARRGNMKRYELVTDEAIDELARRLVSSLRDQRKRNAENRRIAAGRVA